VVHTSIWRKSDNLTAKARKKVHAARLLNRPNGHKKVQGHKNKTPGHPKPAQKSVVKKSGH